MTSMAFTNKIIYKTILMSNEGENDVTFNDKCSVYLENNNMGKVYITYDEDANIYLINAEFIKAGKTNLVLEDENGNKTIFNLNVGYNNVNIEKNKK